jgi:hypothetical protein
MKIKTGRWIYCKYCYKNVKPSIGSIYQIVCPECGCGLTPDFFSPEGLQYYLNTGNYNKAEELKEEKKARKIICDGAWKNNLFREDNIIRNGLSIDCHYKPEYLVRAYLYKKINEGETR